jgi:N-methylhydantoinase B
MRYDPVTLEIVRSRLQQITREMGVVLRRTSFSNIFNEGTDFSTALFDAAGQLVTQAEHVTCHIAAMPFSVAAVLKAFGPDGFRPGDIVVVNDPYLGGTHLPDITVLKPVFHNKRLEFLAVDRGHHVDVGGMRPGSYSGDATTLFQEGLCIPPIKLFDAGRHNDSAWRLILRNVRLPAFTEGDMNAQLAAVNLCEERVSEVIVEYGLGTVRAAASHAIAQSEAMMRAAIRLIPNGIVHFTDYLDPDSFSDLPYPITVRVEVEDDSIHVDFTDCAGQARGPINAVPAVTHGSVYIALLALTNPRIPRNAGCFRPIRVTTRKGSIVDPEFPAAVVGGNTETSCRIINAVWGAMAGLVPERVIGSMGDSTYNFCLGGVDPRSGKPYVWYQFPPGGWGARAGCDAFFPAIAILGADTSNTPQEALELAYPVHVVAYRLATDSAGPGRQRGGQGVEWLLQPVGHITELSINAERSVVSTMGLFGGQPGSRAAYRVYRGWNGKGMAEDELAGNSRSVETLGSRCGGVLVAPDDLIYIRTSGGGGYGPPEERDVAALIQDWRDGRVSAAHLAEAYGVTFDEHGKVASRRAAPVFRPTIQQFVGPLRRTEVVIS